jgi:hypothetical protein
MAAKSAGIMDISDTPDVAVWAKGIRRGLGTSPDAVKEPSKIASTTLHLDLEGQEIAVDPANKKQMSKAQAEGSSLTDESTWQAAR